MTVSTQRLKEGVIGAMVASALVLGSYAGATPPARGSHGLKTVAAQLCGAADEAMWMRHCLGRVLDGAGAAYGAVKLIGHHL